MLSRTLIRTIRKIQRYSLSLFVLNDLKAFRATPGSDRFSTSFKDIFPCIKDKTVTTGFDRHYVYHTAWAARVVQEINPAKHVDISSMLYFCGIVSAFIPVDFYDYRPADLALSNLNSKKGDLHHLPFADKSVPSISCMHTIEHVGLGRYGDPIDAEGDIKALDELKRVTASNGDLVLVFPIGRPRIEFNAHRIYSYEQIISYICDEEFLLKEFTFIPEAPEEGPMVRNADPALVSNASYACGCFWFKRK